MFSQSQSSILIIHDIMLNVIQQLLNVSWTDRNLNFYYCLLLQVRSRAIQLLRSLTQLEINICEKLNLTLSYNLNHLILFVKVYLTRRVSALKKAKYLKVAGYLTPGLITGIESCSADDYASKVDLIQGYEDTKRNLRVAMQYQKIMARFEIWKKQKADVTFF